MCYSRTPGNNTPRREETLLNQAGAHKKVNASFTAFEKGERSRSGNHILLNRENPVQRRFPDLSRQNPSGYDGMSLLDIPPYLPRGDTGTSLLDVPVLLFIKIPVRKQRKAISHRIKSASNSNALNSEHNSLSSAIFISAEKVMHGGEAESPHPRPARHGRHFCLLKPCQDTAQSGAVDHLNSSLAAQTSKNPLEKFAWTQPYCR